MASGSAAALLPRWDAAYNATAAGVKDFAARVVHAAEARRLRPDLDAVFRRSGLLAPR